MGGRSWCSRYEADNAYSDEIKHLYVNYDVGTADVGNVKLNS